MSDDSDLSGGSDSRDGGDSRDSYASRDSGAEGELLAEVGALRRRARADRHAYWFPLILFGLLACASMPFYLRSRASTDRTVFVHTTSMPALSGLLSQDSVSLAYFWLAALLFGLLTTEAWYWWRALRAGLVMPYRAALITTAVLALAAIVIPLLSQVSGLQWLADLLPFDIVNRGMLPLLLIGAGLLVLARNERSWSLAGIALAYTLAALLGNLYNEENLLYRAGWTLSPQVDALPNVILPAAILLISGVAAFAAGQHPHRMARQRLASRELT